MTLFGQGNENSYYFNIIEKQRLRKHLYEFQKCKYYSNDMKLFRDKQYNYKFITIEYNHWILFGILIIQYIPRSNISS